MAINPFRIGQLEIPANPQQRPIDFSGLATLGEGLGRYREQQQLGEIMAGAVDPATGELDWNKAAKAIAISGRDPTKVLSQLTARESLARQEAAQRSQETHQRAMETEAATANRIRQQQADQPQYHYQAPTLLTPGQIIEAPRKPGQPPVFHPWPSSGGPALPPTPPPGPQSEVAPGVLPGPGPTAALNPEQAPPYQVAGPPTPPPTAPGAAAPTVAPAPARNEDFLRTLPAGGQELIKGLADYKIDPAKATPEMLAAARRYRPDYDQGEYSKRATPPSGEVAARIGLAKAFIEKVPAIRERLQANELSSWQGAATALWGQGGPAELRRAIDEGSEALLRGLTGAGMGQSEAAAYARRYQFDVRDNKDTAIRKLNELDNALRHVTTEVGKGRGGEDLLKGFQSQFGKEVAAPKKIATDEEANTLIGQARGALKRDPEKRDEILKRLRERGVRNPELMLGQ